MKARIKETNENIEVVRYCSTIMGDRFECLSTGKRYFHDELELEEEYDEPESGKVMIFILYNPSYMDGYNDGENALIDPDYWTRLEHQAAIDVYRGKTTLEITYRDSVAIDSTVVYKVK